MLLLRCCSRLDAGPAWCTGTADGGGYIYSFNGPHSLFVDTMRSLRALALSHALGHVLLEENDRRVSLLERLVQHAAATARPLNARFGRVFVFCPPSGKMRAVSYP